MAEVNVGLIGAGRIGQLHAEHLAQRVPGARLLAVADAVKSAAQRCAARWNVPAAHDDPEAVFADPSLQAIVICSPTDTHAGFIERAAQAGKHVFCEKPIDFDLENVDRALQAVERAGVKLQVGFNRRFDPSFARAREAVAAGEVGQPHLLHISSRDPAPPPLEYIRVSGGLFLDMTIHDFDMARFLIGSEVSEVYASGKVRVDPHIGEVGDVDTAVVTLRFADGTLGTIDNSRQAVYGYDQRVEVFGSQGVIRVDNPTPHRTWLGNHRGFHGPMLLNFFMERYTESYLREMRAFIRAILDDLAPPVGGPDGRVAVLMGLAASRSLREGRPVRLAEIR